MTDFLHFRVFVLSYSESGLTLIAKTTTIKMIVNETSKVPTIIPIIMFDYASLFLGFSSSEGFMIGGEGGPGGASDGPT